MGLNQLVVLGKSGKMKIAKIATAIVIAPSIKNNQRHAA